MTEWSPTRREFLGVAGGGGLSAAGLPLASWGNVTDAVPDHPFVPAADERWSFDLGDSAYVTGPVDDTLYARTSQVVRAIATDGTRRWRFEVESDYPTVQVGRESASPESDRLAYVNDDHRVYALDAESGDVRWRYEDARRPSVPLALSDLAVAFDNGHLGSDDALVGLSAADGSERWRLPLDGGLWLNAEYDGETFYFGTNEGTFYALDPREGTVRWQVERPVRDDASNDRPRLVAAEPAADLAFAWNMDEGTLYALEVADGSERWRFEADEDSASFLGMMRDDGVYFRDGSSLRVLSTDDGSERWRFDGESMLSWPQVVGDTAYVGNEDAVYAFSTADGRERWRTGAAVLPSDVVSENLVAVDADHSVYGLATDDGSVRWRYDPGEPLGWFPVVFEDAVYLATESGTVVALSDPGPTPVSDALRTVAYPAGLAVGGLLGGALAAGAYRRRGRTAGASDASEAPADEDEPTAVEDFEFVEVIAETDHAEVREARAPDGTRVALKRLREGEPSPEAFRAAVEAWADLDVPGVLDVRAWSLDPVPWVATEYATEGSLGAKAADLTVEERARIVAEVAETVHHAHREGVTHGRLVPGNVLFTSEGVRVGDWRLAVELRDPPEGYVLPESNSGAESDTVSDPEAADTYQLAAMARELLTGDEHDAEGEHDAAELTDVLSRALADDPADRHDSALKFADALRWAVRE